MPDRNGVLPAGFNPAASVRLKTGIDVIENLGGASYACARAGEEQPLTIELRDAAGVAEGGMIETGFEPADAFLFDPGSGARIR